MRVVVEGAWRERVQGKDKGGAREGTRGGVGSSTFARPGPFLTIMPCAILYSSRNSVRMSAV